MKAVSSIGSINDGQNESFAGKLSCSAGKLGCRDRPWRRAGGLARTTASLSLSPDLGARSFLPGALGARGHRPERPPEARRSSEASGRKQGRSRSRSTAASAVRELSGRFPRGARSSELRELRQSQAVFPHAKRLGGNRESLVPPFSRPGREGGGHLSDGLHNAGSFGARDLT